MKYDLSILIPARNEEFLGKTIEDIFKNIRGKTEVIAVLDGYWPNPGLIDDPRLTVIHFTESVGQREGTNYAAKLSRAKYLMKCDAHCAFDEGFDVKMMDNMQDSWTMVPEMRNLHWIFSPNYTVAWRDHFDRNPHLNDFLNFSCYQWRQWHEYV